MYRIGLFSKINKVTVKTLRYYDEAGLLKPAYVDEENGYRYYTSDQLPELHHIMALRQMGFSIEEIADIRSGRRVESIYLQRSAELAETIARSREQLHQIDLFLRELRKEGEPVYQVVRKELPEVIVYSKRMKIPCYDYYFQCIPELGGRVMQANPGLKMAVPEYSFVVYHDGEYKERDIDAEYCEAVQEWGKETDGIVFKRMERVPVAACVLHKGPYHSIGNAYAYLFKWIADNGWTAAGPPREAQIDGIWNKADEQDWLTELQVPIDQRMDPAG